VLNTALDREEVSARISRPAPSLIEWVVDYGTPSVALDGEPVASISGFSPL